MATIRVKDCSGAEHEVQSAGAGTLAQAVYTSGATPSPALCNGLGRCGACKMLIMSEPPPPVEAEVAVLEQHELDAGWRLGCRHAAKEGMRIQLPPGKETSYFAVDCPDQTPKTISLAIDLGTTAIKWAALDQGRVVAHGRELNPQMGAGAEVMSRLAFATTEQGASTLRNLTVSALQRLKELVRKRLHGASVAECCISANSVMAYLLLGVDVAGLAAAPYRLEYTGGRNETLPEEFGLPKWENVYIPPLLSPFIGADLSAGLACIQFRHEAPPQYPYFLADFGTNGECILALAPDKYLTASVALGPALEGVGLTFGGMAGPNTITGVALSPVGVTPDVWRQEGTASGGEGASPLRITGAGYLALVQLLMQHGVLHRDGRFAADPPPTPLGKKLFNNVAVRRGERCFHLTPDKQGLFLSAGDVEELLKVKGAFNLAFSALFDAADCSPGDLCALYVSGALGESIGAQTLEALGFFPAGLGRRVRILGNSSLAGAQTFLTTPEAKHWAEQLPPLMKNLELAAAPDYGRRFLQRMRFEYVP